jgi:TonB family protein
MSLFLSVVLALALPLASPLPQRPPRDPRAADVSSAAASEQAKAQAALEKQIAAAPDTFELRVALAKLQEEAGDYSAAERTLVDARQHFNTKTEPLVVLAAFYNRIGDFDKTVQALQDVEQLEPTKREHPQRVATHYWEKAFRGTDITDAQKRAYVQAGIAATDRALAIDPDFAEAMTYKNILLRMQAQAEADPGTRQQLIAQADELRTRAMALRQKGAPGMPGPDRVSVAPMPPAPPPPPADPDAAGMAPVRVGGNVRAPTKTRDAKPVFPPEALAARVQGVVIIEATIDTSGFVSDAKVLRSIPLLDQAALDAVRQWEFTPTYLNGRAVPVIMTVTVNFSMQ